MPTSCCCYTTDCGYLFPTLLSAKQMRDNVPISLADVQVIYFGAHNSLVYAADIFCKTNDIKFINVPPSILNGNPMLCARFFISKILSKSYKNILYLDGDTQIAGSVAPLLNYEISDETILAAHDPMALKIKSASGDWKKRRQYFNSIGIDSIGQDNYFNSGVMGFKANDWEAVSKESLILY
ncbi:glycosyl transferase family 8, partial [Methylobacterium sp. WL93]|uniref:glycosyltransferase n=1 Tax=Methylobacterium sp. WL93 TaxID=2603892 RepID=UPI0011D42B67